MNRQIMEEHTMNRILDIQKKRIAGWPSFFFLERREGGLYFGIQNVGGSIDH